MKRYRRLEKSPTPSADDVTTNFEPLIADRAEVVEGRVRNWAFANRLRLRRRQGSAPYRLLRPARAGAG